MSELRPPDGVGIGPEQPRTEAEARQDVMEILRLLGVSEGVQWLHRGSACWIARPVEQYGRS